MKTYAINLATSTKNTDLYEKVAVNKFPIIVICKTEDELKQFLSSKESNDYVKRMLRTKKLYEESQWCIRNVYPDNSIRELIWNVSEINNIEY